MQKLVQTVALPGGKNVLLSSTPEAWWTQDDATGYLDPRALAPDPDQPRRRMNPTKLAELEMSVATCGVREAITVTPRSRAPWIRVKPQHEHLTHVIVSGHRRNEAAIKTRLPAVPVRIRVYKDENEHRTDGGVLNACRDDLTELEQGFDFLREQKAGKTFPEIAETHGVNELTVRYRINLTQLHPDLYPLLEPKPGNGKRLLPIYPASILGGIKAPTAQELETLALNFVDFVDATKATGHSSFESLDDDARRFAMQKLLVGVILKRHLNSVRAAAFIRDRTLIFTSDNSRGGEKAGRYKPSRRKDMLMNLAKEVTGSAIVDWSPDEFRRIFGLSSREDDDMFIRQLKAAGDVLAGVIKILTGIRDSKKQTSAEVLQLMQRKKNPA